MEVDFAVVKEKIIKTDEVLNRYLKVQNQLKKAQTAYKTLKSECDGTKNENNRLQIEVERLTYNYDNATKKLDIFSKENSNLKQFCSELESKYNKQTVEHQLNLQKFQDEIQARKIELQLITSPKNTAGNRKLKNLEQENIELKERMLVRDQELEMENKKYEEAVRKIQMLEMEKEKIKQELSESKLDNAKKQCEFKSIYEKRIREFKIERDDMEQKNNKIIQDLLDKLHNVRLDTQYKNKKVLTQKQQKSVGIQTEYLDLEPVKESNDINYIFKEMILGKRPLSPFSEGSNNHESILPPTITITPPTPDVEKTFEIKKKRIRKKFVYYDRNVVPKRRLLVKRKYNDDNILKALLTLKKSNIGFTISSGELPLQFPYPNYNLPFPNYQINQPENTYFTEKLSCHMSNCNTNSYMLLKSNAKPENSELLGFFNVKDEVSSVDGESSLHPAVAMSHDVTTPDGILEKLADLVSDRLKMKRKNASCGNWKKKRRNLKVRKSLTTKLEDDSDTETDFTASTLISSDSLMKKEENCVNEFVEGVEESEQKQKNSIQENVKDCCENEKNCTQFGKLSKSGIHELNIEKNCHQLINLSKLNVEKEENFTKFVEENCDKTKEGTEICHSFTNFKKNLEISIETYEEIDKIDKENFVQVEEIVESFPQFTNLNEHDCGADKISKQNDEDFEENLLLSTNLHTADGEDQNQINIEEGVLHFNERNNQYSNLKTVEKNLVNTVEEFKGMKEISKFVKSVSLLKDQDAEFETCRTEEQNRMIEDCKQPFVKYQVIRKSTRKRVLNQKFKEYEMNAMCLRNSSTSSPEEVKKGGRGKLRNVRHENAKKEKLYMNRSPSGKNEEKYNNAMVNGIQGEHENHQNHEIRILKDEKKLICVSADECGSEAKKIESILNQKTGNLKENSNKLFLKEENCDNELTEEERLLEKSRNDKKNNQYVKKRRTVSANREENSNKLLSLVRRNEESQNHNRKKFVPGNRQEIGTETKQTILNVLGCESLGDYTQLISPINEDSEEMEGIENLPLLDIRTKKGNREIKELRSNQMNDEEKYVFANERNEQTILDLFGPMSPVDETESISANEEERNATPIGQTDIVQNDSKTTLESSDAKIESTMHLTMAKLFDSAPLCKSEDKIFKHKINLLNRKQIKVVQNIIFPPNSNETVVLRNELGQIESNIKICSPRKPSDIISRPISSPVVKKLTACSTTRQSSDFVTKSHIALDENEIKKDLLITQMSRDRTKMSQAIPLFKMENLPPILNKAKTFCEISANVSEKIVNKLLQDGKILSLKTTGEIISPPNLNKCDIIRNVNAKLTNNVVQQAKIVSDVYRDDNNFMNISSSVKHNGNDENNCKRKNDNRTDEIKELKKGKYEDTSTSKNRTTYSLNSTENNLKLPPSKVQTLFHKLVLYSTEEKVTEEVISHFLTQDVDYICDCILARISLDILDTIETKQPKLAPLLTSTQQIFLGFMSKLNSDHSVGGVYDCFLAKAERKLYFNCNLIELTPILRIYIAICKLRKDMSRMRRFCCEAFYFMGDLAVPLFFIVLTSWIEVMPRECESNNYRLSKVLFQIIHLKSCNQAGYNLMPLRQLLNSYYGYPMERWNSDDIFQELLSDYLKKPGRLTDFAILLYCKNHTTKWVYEKCRSVFQPMIGQIPSDNFKATVIILVGNICSQFNVKEEYDFKVVNELRQWLLGLIEESSSDLIRRSIYLSLNRLPKTRSFENKCLENDRQC